MHRFIGVALAMIGATVALLLGRTLYGSSVHGLKTLIQIGIPGVLLVCLAAGCCIVIGLGVALAPGSITPRSDGAARGAKFIRDAERR